MARPKYPMTHHWWLWRQSWSLWLTILVWWAAQNFVGQFAAESLHTVRHSRCFWYELKSLCLEIQFLTYLSKIVLIGCCTSWSIYLSIIELHWHPAFIDWVSLLKYEGTYFSRLLFLIKLRFLTCLGLFESIRYISWALQWLGNFLIRNFNGVIIPTILHLRKIVWLLVGSPPDL